MAVPTYKKTLQAYEASLSVEALTLLCFTVSFGTKIVA